MKKRLLFPIIFLCLSHIWALEITNNYMGWMFNGKNYSPFFINFKSGNYELDFYHADQENYFSIPSNEIRNDGYYFEKGNYSVFDKEGLQYIKFNGNKSFQLFKQAGLLFYGPAFYLCLGNQIFFETGDIDKGPTISSYAEFNKITTSSFLTEKDTVYDGKTFDYNNKNLIPWVENVPGEGIDEWIEFELDNKLEYYEVNNLDTILISNGYVNFDKPQLYSANNRVKKIQITCPENGMDFEAELEDTAQFQAIKLPEPLPQKKKVTVRCTIKEVYKGTRWNDTCINRILIANSEFLEK